MFWRDNPPPGILLDFIDVFVAVLNLGPLNLERGFIDQELFRIKYILIKQGKIQGIDGAHAALLKFRFLLQDIGILLAASSPQLKGLLDRLISSPMQQYYGTRLEIHIAAFLCQKSIPFTCPDPPDFLIDIEQSTISIECTSRNLTVKKDKADVIKGFITAIQNKSKYSFVNGNAGLFIDSTNLAFNNGALFWEEYEATREFLKNEMEKTNFGSVLTFSWIWNTSNDRYEAVYSRIDSDLILKELLGFLNFHYPLGTHIINLGHANIPSIG